MDQLPSELQVVISQYLNSKSKINIRATNSFWRSLCQLDSFTVYGATSENISRIIGTYSKIQQPISISFKKFKRITVTDFAAQVTKLTNLTSLELDKIPDQSYWRDLNNPWLNFRVMTQLTLFKPWCRNKHPFQIYLHLTKLKEFTYNEASWDRDDDRFHARRCINYTVPLLSQLESLELHVQYIEQDPFGLVANPSKLTQLLLAGGTYNMIINEESLKRFINLKKLKLDISLPIELKHFAALEDLKYVLRRDVSCNLEHNTMLTRLVMTCQTIDEDVAASFKLLTNMKKLDLHCINADDDQNRKDSLFECLSSMKRLQSFKISSNSLLSGEFFSFVNSQNLKTIQWSFKTDVDVSPLANISCLRVLVLNQLDKEAIVNYDPVSKLTNVTCLKISGISSTHNLTFISTLTILKVLEIESTNGFGADLNFSTIPDLVSLDILGTTSADVLKRLYSTNITRLCCPLHPGTDYDQLLEYPLRHLRITNDNEEFLLWKTLEQMTSLRRLVFFKIYDFKKLLQLTTLTNLKVLEVTNLKKIPTSYFTKLKSLQKVICYGNTVYNKDE